MKSALYARVSTDEQAERENSIPAQIRAMREYCKKNNIIVHKEYIDEGISGQKEKRPAFQRMIKDAEKGMFDIILVHKFDRFARKIELSRKIKTQLKKAGVNVISITEPIEDSPMGFFVEGLHELLAEYYVKNLAKEVKKGMNERVLKGKHMGQMPFGYKVENGQVLINEEQAKIVNLIFDLYNQGWGHLKIAKHLNEKKVPTYTGKVGAWQSFQISKILVNKKYIGLNEWDGNIYELDIPTIIDKNAFETAQKGYSDKKRQHTYRGNNFEKYVLLGLLKCGECGSVFRIKKSKKWAGGFDYVYICSSASYYRKKCDFTKIFKHEIILKEIEDYIKRIMEGAIENFNVINEKPVDIGDILGDRLARIEKELQRAKDAYLAEVFSIEEYKEIKIKLENEKEKIIIEMPKESDQDKNNKVELIEKIKDVWNLYVRAKTPNEKRRILQLFIRTIEIHKDKIKVIFFI